MRKILGLLALLVTGALAATSALYLHHERSTQATVEADCQNREVCLDKINLAPIGRFNDGTLWHGVTQEKPNVNLTGTLTVTGATVLSNNLTLSLFATGRIPYTTTAGLLTSGTGLTYDGSAFSVTGTAAISGNLAINTNKFTVTASSGNTVVAGTLNVSGLSTTASINATGNISIGSSAATTLQVIRASTDASPPNFEMYKSRGAIGALTDVANNDVVASYIGYAFSTSYFSNAEIRYIVDGTFTTGQRPPSRMEFYTNTANGAQTKQFSIAGSGAAQFTSTLGVTGVTTATGGLTLGASFVDKTTSLTGNTTLTSAHSTIFASASGGSFTLTLPAAAGNTGLTYTIYKTDISAAATGGGNTVTIDGNSSETIGGALTQVLASNTGNGVLRIICDGSNWQILQLYDEGTYLLSGSGFSACTSGSLVSGKCVVTSKYVRENKACTITIPPIAGTSNSTDLSITGLPSSITLPTSYVFTASIMNNSVELFDAKISSLSGCSINAVTVTCQVSANASGFTAAGTKAFINNSTTVSASLTYEL